MARLVVVAFDARLPAWAAAARDAFLRRMPRGYAVECLALKRESARRLRARLPRGARLVALDERGESMGSVQFARRLEAWRREGAAIAFVIGGADGLDAELKRDADALLQLSALTLPHALAQVLLCEQLYRAASLAQGHPYHRE